MKKNLIKIAMIIFCLVAAYSEDYYLQLSDENGIWVDRSFEEYEYDKNGNLIHEKPSNGDECWYEYEYDTNGLMVKKTTYRT